MLLFEALARLGGRLRLPGALRRWPRFARLGLASLGLAELRKWLSSAAAYFFLCFNESAERHGHYYFTNHFNNCKPFGVPPTPFWTLDLGPWTLKL